MGVIYIFFYITFFKANLFLCFNIGTLPPWCANLVRRRTAVGVSFNCKAPDPNLGVLKIRERFLNLVPLLISFQFYSKESIFLVFNPSSYRDRKECLWIIIYGGLASELLVNNCNYITPYFRSFKFCHHLCLCCMSCHKYEVRHPSLSQTSVLCFYWKDLCE